MKCCDYQEILVQERIQMLEVGTMPRSITIILMDDLVDSCRVGIIIPSDCVGRRRYRDHGRCATEVAPALSRREV